MTIFGVMLCIILPEIIQICSNDHCTDSESDRIKVVIVGSSGVGKTYLHESFAKNEFTVNHVPTKSYFNCLSSKVIACDGQSYSWLYEYGHDVDPLRTHSYQETDVFLVCFSLADTSSFIDVFKRWYPETNKHCPTVPVVLIGTKLDLKKEKECDADHGKSAGIISDYQGTTMQSLNRNVVKYIECSAAVRFAMEEVFQEAAIAGLKYKIQRQSRKN